MRRSPCFSQPCAARHPPTATACRMTAAARIGAAARPPPPRSMLPGKPTFSGNAAAALRPPPRKSAPPRRISTPSKPPSPRKSPSPTPSSGSRKPRLKCCCASSRPARKPRSSPPGGPSQASRIPLNPARPSAASNKRAPVCPRCGKPFPNPKTSSRSSRAARPATSTTCYPPANKASRIQPAVSPSASPPTLSANAPTSASQAISFSPPPHKPAPPMPSASRPST